MMLRQLSGGVLSKASLAPAKVIARAASALVSLEDEYVGSPDLKPTTPSAAKTTISTLSNGLKVVSQQTGSQTSSLALLVGIGSRDENPSEHGIALLLQSLAFKSTEKRSSLRLNRDLEDAGVYAAVAAGRETLLLSAECMAYKAGVALEALGEAALHRKFLPWEVQDAKEKIKDVDLEIYGSDPQLLLSEAIHAAAYGDESPLGHPFYTNSKVDAPTLRAFYARTMSPSKMVVAGTGISHDELVAYAEKFSEGAGNSQGASSRGSGAYIGGEERVQADSPLVHIALAVEGVGIKSKDAAALVVLQSILDSRIKAQLPLSTAFASSYSDSGLFGVAAASEPSKAEATTHQLLKALKGLAGSSAQDAEVKAALKAVKISAAHAAESTKSAAGLLAAQVNITGEVQGLKAFDSVTASSIKSIAAKLAESPISIASLGAVGYVPRARSLK